MKKKTFYFIIFFLGIELCQIDEVYTYLSHVKANVSLILKFFFTKF